MLHNALVMLQNAPEGSTMLQNGPMLQNAPEEMIGEIVSAVIPSRSGSNPAPILDAVETTAMRRSGIEPGQQPWEGWNQVNPRPKGECTCRSFWSAAGLRKNEAKPGIEPGLEDSKLEEIMEWTECRVIGPTRGSIAVHSRRRDGNKLPHALP